MTLHWTREDESALGRRQAGGCSARTSWPRWTWTRPPPARRSADEWWQVTGDDGAIAGYGWLGLRMGRRPDHVLVDPARRGAGTSAIFILENLEDEAAARGLNYIYKRGPRQPP